MQNWLTAVNSLSVVTNCTVRGPRERELLKDSERRGRLRPLQAKALFISAECLHEHLIYLFDYFFLT
ncbi:hypothetical protein IAE30_27550 [Pantoea sp. S61]|uniref:hypothetical protein n=1 Tax=Pantoea sp. S61 TaxID=2767442 RepID=UPI00190C5FD0|nr:hypothetical protein [Pantoea sp. S61]MBK0127500.1 hypothetical protein [Pantoea sp. S61]